MSGGRSRPRRKAAKPCKAAAILIPTGPHYSGGGRVDRPAVGDGKGDPPTNPFRVLWLQGKDRRKRPESLAPRYPGKRRSGRHCKGEPHSRQPPQQKTWEPRGLIPDGHGHPFPQGLRDWHHPWNRRAYWKRPRCRRPPTPEGTQPDWAVPEGEWLWPTSKERIRCQCRAGKRPVEVFGFLRARPMPPLLLLKSRSRAAALL